MSTQISEMHKLLLDKGFDSGWALVKEKLIIWEHETDPPAPLVRPQETPEP